MKAEGAVSPSDTRSFLKAAAMTSSSSLSLLTSGLASVLTSTLTSLLLGMSLLTVDLTNLLTSFLSLLFISPGFFSSSSCFLSYSSFFSSSFLFLFSPTKKCPFFTPTSLKLLAPNSIFELRRLLRPSFEMVTASVTWRLRAPRWVEVRVTFQSSTVRPPPWASLEWSHRVEWVLEHFRCLLVHKAGQASFLWVKSHRCSFTLSLPLLEVSPT